MHCPFSSQELDLINRHGSPKHVAFIMDGNRRWAESKGLSPLMGHWEGAETLTKIVEAAPFLGIETLIVYSFSTENWDRPREEVEALMRILAIYLEKKRESMVRDGVCLNMIGHFDRLPEMVKKAFSKTKEATAHCRKINLVLALNYGARDEIRRALVKIIKAKVQPEEVTEKLVSEYLDTGPWSDPELLIRTSGEMRVSNFLLWQISYAEIYVSQELWPNFSPKNLLEAVLVYQHRNRRIGK